MKVTVSKKLKAKSSPADEILIVAEGDKKRVSQADIPAYSLEQALRVPRAIADNYNLKPTTPLKVAAAMGMGPATSTFKMITGAAIAYGLTNGGGQSAQIEIAPLGLRILRPKREGDDLAAKREAFLKPRVIGQFLRQYDGGAIPRRDIATSVLSGDMGVPEARAGDILDMIMEGARDLNLVQKIKEKEYISLEGKRLANPPVRMAAFMLQCPDDRKKQSCQHPSDVHERKFSSWWLSFLAAVCGGASFARVEV